MNPEKVKNLELQIQNMEKEKILSEKQKDSLIRQLNEKISNIQKEKEKLIQVIQKKRKN